MGPAGVGSAVGGGVSVGDIVAVGGAAVLVGSWVAVAGGGVAVRSADGGSVQLASSAPALAAAPALMNCRRVVDGDGVGVVTG